MKFSSTLWKTEYFLGEEIISNVQKIAPVFLILFGVAFSCFRGMCGPKKPINPLSWELLRVSVAQGEEVRALVFLNALNMYLLLLDICQLLITAGNLIFPEYFEAPCDLGTAYLKLNIGKAGAALCHVPPPMGMDGQLRAPLCKGNLLFPLRMSKCFYWPAWGQHRAHPAPSKLRKSREIMAQHCFACWKQSFVSSLLADSGLIFFIFMVLCLSVCPHLPTQPMVAWICLLDAVTSLWAFPAFSRHRC